MTYPIVVGVIVVLILMAMLIFVVPMFKGMYADLDAKLPAPTLVLLPSPTIMKKFFPLVLLGAGFGVWAAKKWVHDTGRPAHWDAFKLRAPVFGQLAHKTALARFSRSLAALCGPASRSSTRWRSCPTRPATMVADAVADTQAAVKSGESLASRWRRTRSSRRWWSR